MGKASYIMATVSSFMCSGLRSHLPCDHCVQLRELTLAAGEAELQELYLAVPELLSERRSDAAAACGLLQVCRRRF